MNLGWPVFIEAKDDGNGGDRTAGGIGRAKLHKPTSSLCYRPDAIPVAQPTVSKH